jgi:hypothetical protein
MAVWPAAPLAAPTSSTRITAPARAATPSSAAPSGRGGYADMPPAANLSERNLDRMITFLREIQRVNGIR